MAKLFDLGTTVLSAGVLELMRTNPFFNMFVRFSLGRYSRGDWGDVCEEDARAADQAVKDGTRIQGVYIYDYRDVSAYIVERNLFEGADDTIQWVKTEDKDRGAVKIWIMTEWDRSKTTILFPKEY